MVKDICTLCHRITTDNETETSAQYFSFFFFSKSKKFFTFSSFQPSSTEIYVVLLRISLTNENSNLFYHLLGIQLQAKTSSFTIYWKKISHRPLLLKKTDIYVSIGYSRILWLLTNLNQFRNFDPFSHSMTRPFTKL